jgi:hypothetical protein
MARPKRLPHPLLGVARAYIAENMPEMQGVPLRLHHLDGPPGSPRYAITADVCHKRHNCPLGVPAELAENGKCPIIDCSIRQSIRLLFDRNGELIKTTESGIRWS